VTDGGEARGGKPDRPFEAVVFDLDGVLVDSEVWWDEVRADLARRHGRPWTEDDRAAVMGQNSRQWSLTMRDRLGIDEPPEVLERAVVDAVVERYRRDGPPTIEGAVEVVLRVGRDLRTAVASSAHREVIDASLAALGLADAFEVVVSSDEVAAGKPAPDVYLEAARRLGVVPRACLVVEDSRNGVLAGIAAGMTVALVPNNSIPPAPGAREAASVVLESLSGILGILGLA
jgi:HAD superfamily hydrolase (TIGR01509 family)